MTFPASFDETNLFQKMFWLNVENIFEKKSPLGMII